MNEHASEKNYESTMWLNLSKQRGKQNKDDLKNTKCRDKFPIMESDEPLCEE